MDIPYFGNFPVLLITDARYGFSNDEDAQNFMSALVSVPTLGENSTMIKVPDAPEVGDVRTTRAFVAEISAGDEKIKFFAYSVVFRIGRVVGFVEVGGFEPVIEQEGVYVLFQQASDRTRDVLGAW